MRPRTRLAAPGRDDTSPAVARLTGVTLDVGLARAADALLGGGEVMSGHLDAQDALALMADDVERLRPSDRSGHGLAVTAALTGDYGPHFVSHIQHMPRWGCRRAFHRGCGSRER